MRPLTQVIFAMTEQNDQYKEKFRPVEDNAIDQQVSAALADVSLEHLYGFDQPKPAETPQAPVAPGSKVPRRGKVISVGRDDVFVDVGGKSQGICPLLQFEEVKLGDEFDFYVDRYEKDEGLLILTRKGATSQSVNWETLEVGQIVEGSVEAMNKGGLELTIKNMRAFMPAGQVDVNFVKDISTLIGQRMTVEVTKVDREKKNLIVSRRAILEREKEEARLTLMKELAVDQVRRGVVRTVMDYGAFVDMGGVDGLLHVSEMSHRRIRHPNEVVKENDVVDVKITKIDPETGKISLSLKAAMADPWAEASTRYAVGTTVTGRVARIEGFGAFVSVEDGIEGLLPVSEISYQRIRHPGDVLKEGEPIKVIVLSMDPLQHRLSFSLKQAGPDPWSAAESNFPVNSVVDGKVSRVVEFGAFVELEAGIEGLVHISELANNRVRAASDVVKPGQDVKVRVMEFDKEKRRIGLSLRRATEPVAAATTAEATPAAPAPPKKKRPVLRGGLDY